MVVRSLFTPPSEYRSRRQMAGADSFHCSLCLWNDFYQSVRGEFDGFRFSPQILLMNAPSWMILPEISILSDMHTHIGMADGAY